jgi:hypothetical protein
MREKFGNAIYWTAWLIATLIIVFTFTPEAHPGDAVIVAIPCIVLVGWTVRYVLAGNKSIRL